MIDVLARDSKTTIGRLAMLQGCFTMYDISEVDYLIDEVLLVKDLLNGTGINKKCLYQHCYLMAKYYLQRGCTFLETRQEIFDLATKYGLYLDARSLNLNQIIYKAKDDKRPLRKDMLVYISEADINRITERFNNTRTQKIALALLCYAKAAADSDNCFDISVLLFSNWIGLDHTQLYRKYLKELQTFGYIELVDKNQNKTFSRSNKIKSKSARFKLLVPFKNLGEYQLHGNDIDSLYNECFLIKNQI